MVQKAVLKTDPETKVKKPNLYKVILINDDYTTMDFVVEILIAIFHKTPSEATRIMLDVHQKGKGIVGLYTYDIAYTKVLQVEKIAIEKDFPLKVIMEKE
jgi:ATP-dependent Clp protease adaptor protein ClpS